MHPSVVLAALLGLVGAATVLGLLWRATQGRARATSAAGVAIELPGVGAEGRIALVQFSGPVCAPCVPTRALLGEVAAAEDGVHHLEFDVTAHPELASRHNVMQTPTTLIVDGSGRVRSRIHGAPRRDALIAEVKRLVAETTLNEATVSLSRTSPSGTSVSTSELAVSRIAARR